MRKQIMTVLMGAALALALIVGAGGCATQKASPTGVYQGDTALRNVELATVEAYKNFDKFVTWERDFRPVLPVEVSRAADLVRLNAKKWIDSAITLRDAYVTTPTPGNKDKMKLALNLVEAGLTEAVKYQTTHKLKAPTADPVKAVKF